MGEDSRISRMTQMNQARDLAKSDPSYIPQIVSGVLPFFNDSEQEVRFWVSDFLADVFCGSQLSASDKENLALQCFAKLVDVITIEKSVRITKSFIQLFTVLYPILFRHVAQNLASTDSWHKLSLVKRNIFDRWDSSEAGLHICCIKFAQRVVSIQTYGAKDPRLTSKDDISLDMVKAEHPLLNALELSAEADALIDRLIAILTDRPVDSILISAAINSLSVLARSRVTQSSRIINAVLSCTIPDSYPDLATPAEQLHWRCAEKAIRVAMTHLLKVNAAGASGPRVQQYLLKQAQKSQEDGARKRPASDKIQHPGKRLRTEVDGIGTPQPSILSIPPFPDGGMTLATIFNLSHDNALASFDVKQLPQELVVQIIVATLSVVSDEQLRASLQTTKSRYSVVKDRTTVSLDVSPNSRSLEYAQVVADHEHVPTRGKPVTPLMPGLSEEFELPDSGPSSNSSNRAQYELCTDRILHNNYIARSGSHLNAINLHKTLGSAWDRATWIAVITRLATRTVTIASCRYPSSTLEPSLATTVRTRIFDHVMANFRDNMDFCTSWLNEEWYAAMVSGSDRQDTLDAETLTQYELWTLKVLDGVLPFLEASDRPFMRFLSDLPCLTSNMISKVATLCHDPNRSQLGYTTFQYLIMLRPPVRNLCLDIVQQLYLDDNTEFEQQRKILQRWRPDVLSDHKVEL